MQKKTLAETKKKAAVAKDSDSEDSSEEEDVPVIAKNQPAKGVKAP